MFLGLILVIVNRAVQYYFQFLILFLFHPQYSLSYAFLKLVNFSFFFWLPYYLTSQYGWEEKSADEVSTFYDIGGILGKMEGRFCFCFQQKRGFS